MPFKIIEKNWIKWVAAHSPSEQEIAEISEKIVLEPQIKEELLKPTMHPKINAVNSNVYLVLHFPIFDKKKSVSKREEIDFVIGKNFLLTVCYNDNFEPIKELLEKLEENSEYADHYARKGPEAFFFFIINYFYNFALRELNYIQKNIDEIEEQIFLKKERAMVEKIYIVSRDVIQFGNSINPHRRILEDARKQFLDIYGKGCEVYFSEILNKYFHLENIFKAVQSTINSLQATNDSLVSIKSNEQMRTLSIVAFITFPLMLIASVFGMNAVYMPIIGEKGDFWIIISLMAAGFIGMYGIFKNKKWI